MDVGAFIACGGDKQICLIDLAPTDDVARGLLIFDDFTRGMERFGRRVQPPAKSGAHISWLRQSGSSRNARSPSIMKIGVFIPIGSRGWLMSTTSPKTMPSFDLNRAIVQRAEFYGLDFALSMIKLRGYNGPSEY
jgi:hypothetical protein